MPLLTRNVPIDVFLDELNMAHLALTLREELNLEVSSFQLFQGVDQTLPHLKELGLRVGLCSNLAYEYGSTVRKLLPGLDSYVFSYEVGVTKPNPLIYEKVCETLGVSPEDVLFVGDSKRCDFDGPKAFGMQALLLDKTSGQTLTEIFGNDELLLNRATKARG